MKNIVSILFVVVLASVSAVQAHADNSQNDAWKKKHPRRAEVNQRDRNLHNKSNAAVANGQITQRQDNRLNRQEKDIHRQEQRDAAANGGHITPAEQQKLNHEENGVNREMKRDETRDANKSAGTNPAAPVAPTTPVVGQ